ncbi:MAG: DUF839 domain-containing protein [Oscillatoria sp. PMC 1068.18]|nr:DUF839 domain-containing protein [Oscillatoria sp. PMC 1076.18]MEC4988035.1 DUF839 domain-containing protein [Oscillatoria sp. PMC 1068.18]
MVISGKTSATQYVVNVNDIDPVTGVNPQYDYIPLLTVGDQIPLLEGEFGNFTTSATENYAMAGIPDGLGHTQINGLNYVWMNHEISTGVYSSIDGNITVNDANGDGRINAGETEGEVINGARVSLFVFDENWDIVGGKNLIEDVDVDGVIYSLNTDTGDYEDSNGNVLEMTGHENFSRFCSGYLAAQGFVDENGGSIPIYFAPEETSDGLGIAVYPDGTASPIRGLGVYSKEQVYAASEYRATNSDTTVILATEDNGDGEIYMYVGEQTAADPNGLNDTTNSLFVLQVVDPETGEAFPLSDMPENEELIARWVLIPDAITLNPDPDVLSDYVNNEAAFGGDFDGDGTSDGLGDFNNDGVVDNLDVVSTNFRRPEDLNEDPNNPGTFYWTSTGTDEIGDPSNPFEETDDPSLTDDPFGKLFRFTLNPEDPTADGTFEFLLEGGPDTGVSYDNMVVDSNGNVIIQEDRTAFGADVLFGEPPVGREGEERNGRILSYNIALNEGKLDDEITFIGELNQSLDSSVDTDYGDWESSGIIEIDSEVLPGRSSYLLDVQAHSIRDAIEEGGNIVGRGEDGASVEDVYYDGAFVEGGQLLLAIPTEATENIFGSTEDDEIDVAAGDADGTKELIFTGEGEDLVDTSSVSFSGQGSNRVYAGSDSDELFAGKGDRLFGDAGDDILDASVGQGGNRLYGGEGSDELYAGTNDRLFGGEGDDTLDATVGSGDNRLYGGAGDDTFILGTGDVLVGGEGADKFFVTAGGDNVITGGEGADQFWLASSGKFADAENEITDFEAGLDVIGIGGTFAGLDSFDDLDLSEVDGNTTVSFGDRDLATFIGVSENDLSAANFVFDASVIV